jgi:pimeloyl-ACP methyl ester carboxylesterase
LAEPSAEPLAERSRRSGHYDPVMASVDSNGITLEYEMRGEGDPLLLVMGLGAQMTDWPDEFVSDLVEAGFRVITFDNRDIGLSTEFTWQAPSQIKTALGMMARRPVKSEYLLSDMAADAVGLLDALGIESAHVAGASMGGMISQTIAIEHPDRVRSLTSIMSNTGDRRNGRIAGKLISKMVRLPPPTRETAVERSVTTFRLVSGPHFDESEHRLLAKRNLERSYRPEGAARQTAAIAASPDRTPGLRRLKVPTLVVHGLVDPLVKPSGGVATAKAVPGSRLVMYPDMGHDLPRPRWADMIGEIRRTADQTR